MTRLTADGAILTQAPVLTIDVDWAPEFAIQHVAERLIAQQVRATWFITHLSLAAERLREYPELFEIGVHPNLLAGSSHGATTHEVLAHCLELAPGARSMRTHSLVQSTPLLAEVVTQTPIVTDVSLFLPHTAGLRPAVFEWHGKALLRIPFLWEDDIEFECSSPCWRLDRILALGDGMKVFDFHPIHVYLNSSNSGPYQALKARAPDLVKATRNQVDPLVSGGEGTGTMFGDIVDYLQESGGSLRVNDIHASWLAGGERGRRGGAR